MDLLEFITISNMAATKKKLQDNFLSFIKSYGFEYFTFGDQSPSSISEKNRKFDLVSNYPAKWLAYYKERNLALYDPVYQSSYLINTPMTWDVIARMNKDKRAADVMNKARENSLVSGIGIPLHCSSGCIYGMSLAAPSADIDFSRDAQSLYNAAAHQFLVVYGIIAGFIPSSSQAVLTSREKEILQWVATGKTKGEIAAILTVSESCIKRHCEHIFFKLNVQNLPSAVARAIRLRLIRL